MGYEVDFLAVGEASKGGDAIAIRFGNPEGTRDEQTVVVIDGGYSKNGDELVQHIKTHYGTSHVDYVISTHPDRDHIKGLEVVLEEMSVGVLLMHQPEAHDVQLSQLRALPLEYKVSSVGERLAKSLDDTESVLAIAKRRGVRVIEPFAGVATEDGSIRILGPSKEYYEELLAEMKGGTSASSLTGMIASALGGLKERAFKFLDESLHIETLSEESDVSASNNSSVITLITVDGMQLLFSGDAGADALHRAATLLEAEGFVAGSLRMMQVPHHGSRRNVTPSVLDRLLGPKGSQDVGHALVSCPPENPEAKHPAKVVLNAFSRRGYGVLATAGSAKGIHQGFPLKSGWVAVEPLPFYDQVEDHDA